jgi:hypothetical protein
MPTHTPAPSWEPTARQRELLFLELGMCLYVFQSIEGILKALLPHFTVPGTDEHAPGEGFENWRIFLDSKETLGPMMRRFLERTSSPQSELLEQEWRRIVSNRNDVVHHFVEQRFARLDSEEQYAIACEFLRSRRLHALPMFEMLQDMLKHFTEELQSSGSGAGAA